jgi:hypothetical protein
VQDEPGGDGRNDDTHLVGHLETSGAGKYLLPREHFDAVEKGLPQLTGQAQKERHVALEVGQPLRGERFLAKPPAPPAPKK